MNAPDKPALMVSDETSPVSSSSGSPSSPLLSSPLLGALSNVFASSTPAWIKMTTLGLLLIGLLLSSFAYQLTRDSVQQRDQVEFDRRVSEAVDEVTSRLDTHAMLVTALQGLFRAKGDASRLEFHRFVQSMKLGNQDTDVLAQTWDPVVPRNALTDFEVRVRSDDSLHEGGYPDFRVVQGSTEDSAFVVTYVEPYLENRAAMGFDLSIDPLRRGAVETARDTGKLVATPPIPLIRDKLSDKGYLMMLPVYGAAFPKDLRERRQQFTGVVVAVFRVGNLIGKKGDFGAVQVWDTTDSPERDDEQLVYAAGTTGPGVSAERQVAVGGRTWILRFEQSSLTQNPRNHYLEWLIGFTSVLATLLATALFALLATSRQRALANASALTQDLQDANEELNRSNADLSQFAHIASHDLQTPVRNVISAVDLLEDHLGESADEDTRQLLGYLQSSATRMRKLVLELLDYAKLGRDAIHFSTIRLDDVLQEAVKLTLNQCRETGTTLHVENLPIVDGDSDQLERVFVNLITNAIKYAHPDRKPVVTIACRNQTTQIEGKACVEITVADNGQGMEARHHATVFQPFKRLHRHDEIEGTGLGLAICKQIVERHGGTITIASSDSNGTIFLICLPHSSPETLGQETPHPVAPG